MSIEELELILYDMYQMDTCMPPLFGMWKGEFKNISYSVWAVDEVKNYIIEQIHPHTYGTVDEFCEITRKFIAKTTRYSKMNSENQQIIQAARDMAINILELLEAMK